MTDPEVSAAYWERCQQHPSRPIQAACDQATSKSELSCPHGSTVWRRGKDPPVSEVCALPWRALEWTLSRLSGNHWYGLEGWLPGRHNACAILPWCGTIQQRKEEAQ